MFFTEESFEMSHEDWWRGAVFYQIYPRSFKDTTGNGNGDLPGITEKLDYVASLGVDAIWINPFFPSPMKDSGYDVSDYRSVDPLFGTMDDFKALLDKAHDLGLKVVIDQVLSHTSEEHPWFKESRRTRDNPKTDWYVWENPRRDGMPPTNWLARFGGPAWTYSIRRGQYYLHNFYPNQPDLNLHNEEVQDTLLASMEMWLKIGVDGFRMDAVSFYMHDRRLRDNPFQPLPEENKIEGLHFVDPYTMQIHKYNQGAPEIFHFLKRIRALMDKYPGTITIGEASGASSEETMKLAARYTEGNKYLHTAYSHTLLGGGSLKESFIRKHVEGYENLPQDSWPSWAFSNHDVYRAVSRLNRGEGRNPRFAKLLIAILCSLKGTPFIYQGEELGLPEADLEFEDLLDHWAIFTWPEWKGRDGARTPMPWRDELGSGFTTADQKTWLPIPDEHRAICAGNQDMDPDSPLQFTRAFLKWRKEQLPLIKGEIEFLDTQDIKILAFVRKTENEKILCVFNLGPEDKALDTKLKTERLTFSLSEDQSGLLDTDSVKLPAFGIYFGKILP